MRSFLLVVGVALWFPTALFAQQRPVDAPAAGRQVWPSKPPKDCPFP